MDPSVRPRLTLGLTRLKGGERAAAKDVFELAWPVVQTFCRRLLSGANDAEDVAQQVLMKVFAQVMTYDPRRDALAWVLEIAVWESRTALRRRSRAKEAGLADAQLALPDGAQRPDESMEARELNAALHEVLGQLSLAEREVVLGEVTALNRGVSAPAWRKRRERALSRLKLLWRTSHGLE